MIQFNLLPDVKLEYIKAQRTRQAVILVSIIVSIVSLVIFALFFGYNQIEKKHLRDLTADITTETRQLKNKPNLNKVLTLQNQLEGLTQLHDVKPDVPRLFGYLDQVTPNGTVSITSLTGDFNLHTFSITGTSDSLTEVNQFVDTLKFTKYKIKDSKAEEPKAFSKVVLSKFAYVTPVASGGVTPTDKPATFTVDFEYDPVIFLITQKDLTLDVKSIYTTRSEAGKPTELFTQAPVTVKTTTGTTTTTTTTGSTTTTKKTGGTN